MISFETVDSPFRGTDGFIYKPNVKKSDVLHVFNRDLCRSIPLVFEKDIVDKNGIPGYRYVQTHIHNVKDHKDSMYQFLFSPGLYLLKMYLEHLKKIQTMPASVIKPLDHAMYLQAYSMLAFVNTDLQSCYLGLISSKLILS